MRLNATLNFTMRIPNKRELQQIASTDPSDVEFRDLIKLYKDYPKEPYHFQSMIQLCHQIIR